MYHNRKVQMFLSVFVILALALGVLPMQSAKAYGGTTWYVRQGGSDTNCNGMTNANYDETGSACAFASLPRALSAAVTGEIIYVANGASTWNIWLAEPLTIDKGVKIVLADKVWVRQTSTPSVGVIVIDADGVRISSETINNAGITGNSGVKLITVNSGHSDVIIDGLLFSGNNAFSGNDAGIYFAGAVSNIQLVNNSFDYFGTGHDIQFAAIPTGVVDIMGNYFGLSNDGAIEFPSENSISVKYNNWGYESAPDTDDLDALKAASSANYTPWTHAQVAIQFDFPFGSGNTVIGDTVTVGVYMNATNVVGADFVLTFPTSKVRFESASRTGSHFSNEASLDTDPESVNSTGRIRFHGSTPSYAPLTESWALIYKATFTTLASNYADFNVDDTSDSYTMDAGYGPTNNISDEPNNRRLNIYNAGDVTGTVSMQGRIARDGAVMKFWQSSTEMKSATSLDQITGNLSFSTVIDGEYFLSVIKAGYLDLTYDLGKTASFASDSRTLNSLELIGGDANDDNVIDSLDAEQIGADYGLVTSELGSHPASDINSSGKVDIYDLALMGGNYDLTSSTAYSSWSAQQQ